MSPTPEELAEIEAETEEANRMDPLALRRLRGETLTDEETVLLDAYRAKIDAKYPPSRLPKEVREALDRARLLVDLYKRLDGK